MPLEYALILNTFLARKEVYVVQISTSQNDWYIRVFIQKFSSLKRY